MITVITPTGDRPLVFGLCRKWIGHQTVKPDQWIIVDDGAIPMEAGDLPAYACYMRREPRPDDPKHTLTINMKASLPLIKGDKILIMEDDEYYAAGYIEEMARQLDSYEVAGIGDAKYYHLPTGGYDSYGNMQHASLAETGFRASFLPVFAHCVEQGMDIAWLDDRMWKRVRESKATPHPISSLVFVDSSESLYVGIKGLPGRKGIGIGHNPATYRKHVDDAARTQLKRWIPKDCQTYLDIIEGKYAGAQ